MKRAQSRCEVFRFIKKLENKHVANKKIEFICKKEKTTIYLKEGFKNNNVLSFMCKENFQKAMYISSTVEKPVCI